MTDPTATFGDRPLESDPLALIRRACRQVAEGAAAVSIVRDRLPAYAAALAREPLGELKMDPGCHFLGAGEDTVAFFLTLDAVNFGSGYFPEIFGPRSSGYARIAAALTDRFRDRGPLAAAELSALDGEKCRRLFGLEGETDAARELAALFAGSLRELGDFLASRFDCSFAALVAAAGGSAARLVGILLELSSFRDTALWQGIAVPFCKRAQIAAADLYIAFAGEGPGHFTDIERLTIFADNLVPHVLRHDGILVYRQDLAERIDGGVAIPAGSSEEVEIRGCAVQAAELLVAELQALGCPVNALQLDNHLWHRGQLPAYRARPRHRTRTIYY